MRIGYQGATGAYSEAAALRGWPHAEALPFPAFEDVFAAVASGRVSHGILPVENSIGGSIHQNYDLLLERDLPIVAETELPVVHNLLALPGTDIGAIRRVFSHPQALAQCERFLRTLPGVEIVATYDTAGSARLVREGELRDTAAVASARAAEVFGLDVLRAGIQDFADNITRFLVIGKNPEPLGTPDKTTLAFAVRNEPGSLFKALSVFALRDIDLTKLESRPIRGTPWEYLFYADLAAARDELRCGRAIVHLAESARWVKTLGSYARWQAPVVNT
ncbi:MAG: prephenate dehydratase [Acidobacteria bacterium]|nr:prephenate dehydratase [Acidobacteriota bacterium]MCA1652534.1 prephenate dehydratase [Acidobacteriota bacterium]